VVVTVTVTRRRTPAGPPWQGRSHSESQAAATASELEPLWPARGAASESAAAITGMARYHDDDNQDDSMMIISAADPGQSGTVVKVLVT
jgi:hypothetical protein